MSEGVKGSEEQDDRFRLCDDCSMIYVVISCCVMCMKHVLCGRWLGGGTGRRRGGDGWEEEKWGARGDGGQLQLR